ncbi:hypothetical protein FSP39_014105 [Pinctada imbricata]|uniref:Reverse transcriptase domain-containing protein n=1 Tax=Pinctada imbricata TaxID=66713 RepID=A0AA88YUW2_PINIB|nr:hypothetical protein FSP39_014105 [Pinctada imbricata]
MIERYRSEVGDQIHTFIENKSNIDFMSNDELDQMFCDILKSCAKSIIPCKKFNPHTKPYWNSDVKAAHKHEKEMRRVWLQAGQPRGMNYVEYANYKRAKRKFRNCQKTASDEYMTRTMQDIDQAAGCDIRLFWKLVKGQKPKTKKIYPEIKSCEKRNVIANTPEEVAGAFAHYFKKICDVDKNQSESYDENHRNYIDQEYENIKQKIREEQFDYSMVPGGEISSTEIQNCIRNLKYRKAPGVDELQAEHVKYGGTEVEIYLCILFNRIIRESIIPRTWRESLIVPLYKGGDKDKTNPDSYRPVSLLCTSLKIFEKVIYEKIKSHTNILSKICCQQQGFLSNSSCITTSFNLQETVNFFFENHSEIFAAFLDSRKAFDTVWRKGLMFKLYEIGITGKLWYVIDNMHLDTTSTIVVNNVTSSSFMTSQGVRQGGVLSGFLYIVFINELLQELEVMSPQLGKPFVKNSNPSYADDITCLNSSPNGLQSMLNICFTYSCKWRFQFNAKKSIIVVFENVRIQRRNFETRKWYIGTEIVTVHNECKHLGILLDRKLSNTCRIIEACSKGRKTYFSLKSSMTGPVNPVTMANLYKKVIVPTVLYGCELWNSLSKSDVRKLNQFQHFVLKDIQGFNIRTRSDISESLLGLTEIIREVDRRKLLFFGKLCSLDTQSNTKGIFRLRIFDFVYKQDNSSSCKGFVVDVVKLLHQYSLIDYFENYLTRGFFIRKDDWKLRVNTAISEKSKDDWLTRTSRDLDFEIFLQLHSVVDMCPARVWIFAKESRMLKLAYFIARLWTVPEKFDPVLCPLCQSIYTDLLTHITGVCQSVTYVRDSFWIDIIDNFSVGVCAELSAMDENDFLLCLLGRPISSQFSDECNMCNEIDFLRLCFTYIRNVTAIY